MIKMYTPVASTFVVYKIATHKHNNKYKNKTQSSGMCASEIFLRESPL